jgi:hypothetical protein
MLKLIRLDSQQRPLLAIDFDFKRKRTPEASTIASASRTSAHRTTQTVGHRGWPSLNSLVATDLKARHPVP